MTDLRPPATGNISTWKKGFPDTEYTQFLRAIVIFHLLQAKHRFLQRTQNPWGNNPQFKRAPARAGSAMEAAAEVCVSPVQRGSASLCPAAL